jgi:clan AA aspartic protease
LGHVYVKLVVSNPADLELTATVDALVDTGATSTVVPRVLADSLRLPVIGRLTVRTATGDVDLDNSGAVVQINGRRAYNPILISDTIDKTLVGVITLEALGLSVDPKSRQLKEAELFLYRVKQWEADNERSCTRRCSPDAHWHVRRIVRRDACN